MRYKADFLYIQFEKVTWKGERTSVCTVGMQCEAVFLYIQQGKRCPVGAGYDDLGIGYDDWEGGNGGVETGND